MFINSSKKQNMENRKILVAFFSRVGENYAVGYIKNGNTHIISEMIATEVDGDLFQIKPVTTYPEDYAECTRVAKQELDAKVRPAILNDVAVEDYDSIFIGYPNWWGDMPMPLYTFIEKHDWHGKTVIPFCTHEGSGLSDTESKLESACKGSIVKKGLAVRGSIAQNRPEVARQSLMSWLNKLGY